MAIHRVNATRTGQVLAAAGGRNWAEEMARALDGLPAAATVTVLVHGYRFSWRADRRGRETCAQALLYRSEIVAPSRRRRPERADWPARLGFAEGTQDDGLCIAFGWDARRGRVRSLLRGSNDFARVYRGAETAGRALAQVLGLVAERRPDLRPGLLTHSLGARVALGAIRVRPDLRLGRVVMLAAADYAGEARRSLTLQHRAGGTAEFVNVTSRANDLYDLLFTLFAPAPETRGDRPLGWGGLGIRHPRWRDLQIDHPGMRDWLAARGLAGGAPVPRVSHWHFYGDPGAMAFWRALLRAGTGSGLAPLSAIRLPDGAEPRFARLLPVLPQAVSAPAADEAATADAFSKA